MRFVSPRENIYKRKIPGWRTHILCEEGAVGGICETGMFEMVFLVQKRVQNRPQYVLLTAEQSAFFWVRREAEEMQKGGSSFTWKTVFLLLYCLDNVQHPRVGHGQTILFFFLSHLHKLTTKLHTQNSELPRGDRVQGAKARYGFTDVETRAMMDSKREKLGMRKKNTADCFGFGRQITESRALDGSGAGRWWSSTLLGL